MTLLQETKAAKQLRFASFKHPALLLAPLTQAPPTPYIFPFFMEVDSWQQCLPFVAASVMTAAPKRTRESASKVRTGCTTCKARRVKCDEAKPACRRCAIGGRKCEYHTARAVRSREVITVYLPPAQNQPVLFINNRGLDFFHRNIAANLDGQFNSGFWSKLVLQLSHSEPAIRHAVSAISIAHQDIESSLKHPAGYVDANPEALRALGAAMKCLSARIQVHPNSKLVPLVCCLLFTCIEFLMGNVESSVLHVQSGFNIVAARYRNSNAATNMVSSSDLKSIDDHIVPIFSRLNVLFSLTGRRVPPIHAPIAEENSPHEDFADSRIRLVNIINVCLQFIDEAITKAATFQINFNDVVEQTKLQSRLDTWRDQLDGLTERMQTADDPAKQDAVNLLLVHYKVIYIWIRVCTTAGEMAADSYFDDFEELVHYAGKLVRRGVGMATPQLLSFEIQLLAPLYDTALKCRHPVIRRQALELLRLVPRREGIWNGHHAYVTARQVIELEEATLNEQGLPDETSRLRGFPLPDERSRISNLGKLPFDSQKLGYRIVLSPAYPGTDSASLIAVYDQ
jgi:hypothetical protein